MTLLSIVYVEEDKEIIYLWRARRGGSLYAASSSGRYFPYVVLLDVLEVVCQIFQAICCLILDILRYSK